MGPRNARSSVLSPPRAELRERRGRLPHPFVGPEVARVLLALASQLPGVRLELAQGEQCPAARVDPRLELGPVPQQRLVRHLHEFVAAGPVTAGDQQPLVREPAGHGLTRVTQLAEARPAAQVGTGLPDLDQGREDAGYRLPLVRLQAAVDPLGTGDDGLLQAAHGAIGIERQGRRCRPARPRAAAG